MKMNGRKKLPIKTTDQNSMKPTELLLAANLTGAQKHANNDFFTPLWPEKHENNPESKSFAAIITKRNDPNSHTSVVYFARNRSRYTPAVRVKGMMRSKNGLRKDGIIKNILHARESEYHNNLDI